MKLDLKGELDDLLAKFSADWTEEDRETIRQVGVGYADAMARKLLGQDVDQELRDLKAAARNIAVAGATSGAKVFGDAVLSWATKILAIAIPAAL